MHTPGTGKKSIIDANKAAELATGYAKDEVVGRNIFALGIIPPDQADRAKRILVRILRREKTDPEELKQLHLDRILADTEPADGSPPAFRPNGEWPCRFQPRSAAAFQGVLRTRSLDGTDHPLCIGTVLQSDRPTSSRGRESQRQE